MAVRRSETVDHVLRRVMPTGPRSWLRAARGAWRAWFSVGGRYGRHVEVLIWPEPSRWAKVRSVCTRIIIWLLFVSSFAFLFAAALIYTGWVRV